MILIERIRKGKELIAQGKSYGKDTNALEAEVKTLQRRLEDEVMQLKLSEFEKRDIGIEIFSEVLGGNLWLCSDKEMASQVRGDDPEAICYTIDELRQLLGLDPSPADLQKIHDTKTVFAGAKIKEPVMHDINKISNE